MSPPDEAVKHVCAEIGFDADAVLARDSRVVLDPNFLAALHGELARELDAEQTATTLLQMGFLHGLQDATRALALTAESRPYENMASLTLPLRMPCRFFERADAPGAIWIEGSWPDHQEAQAYLSALSRRGGEGVCYLSAGYTSGWLSGAFDIDLVAVETSCSASGEHDCQFVAREAAEWSSRGDPRAARSLAALPFAALRAFVRERLPVIGPVALDPDRPRCARALVRTARHAQRQGERGGISIRARVGGQRERARDVLEAVQEAHLEQRRRRLLGIELARELRVQRGEEARVQHDARVAREHGFGVEADLLDRRVGGVVGRGHGGGRSRQSLSLIHI